MTRFRVDRTSVWDDDGRCDDMACAVYDVLQPEPIVDPLWPVGA